MSSPKVRVVISGLGRIGSAHLNNLLTLPVYKLVGIVEVLESLRIDWAAKLEVKHYGTIEEAVADKSNPFDAVLICTPTSFHGDHIKASLNAGKQVFCEKPISTDIAVIDEVYTLAKEKGLHLLCGFQRRHDHSFSRLQRELVKGTIGKIVKIKSISRDHPFPEYEFLKTSGGIVMDCLTHDVDVQRWLAGEDPTLVYALGTAIDPEIASFNDFDTLEVLYKFPSGVISSCDVSRHSKCGYDQRVEVLGTEGIIQAENPRDSTVIIGLADSFRTDPMIDSFPTRYRQAYTTELVHFADLVLGKVKVPLVSHKDVRNNTIILLATSKAAQTGLPEEIKYDI